MAHYPTIRAIHQWTPYVVDTFRSIMPPIHAAYPDIHVATAKTYSEMRSSLLVKTGCKHTEEPETSIMEYIHGDAGYAVLIRQDLIPDKNDEHFCWMLWHELGHFYAINSERTNLHHYADPGLADESQLVALNAAGKAVCGLSDERLKQEGYWFWQEFIAEAISKYVSYKHRPVKPSYHPELIDWRPDLWGDIVERLMTLLDETFFHYSQTIDEYSLAHYFANLLMDDFIVLYVKAAADGKLKIYDNSTRPPKIVGTKPGEIEPTCISDIEEEELRKPLWKMKDLLEKQMAKEDFWMIDESFLLEIGRCIGDMMFAKLMLLARHRFD